MKALTYKQPYAMMMLHGKIETRPWDTNYRGSVLICAGLTQFSLFELVDMTKPEHCISIIKCISGTDVKFLVPGRAIAVADLVETRPMQKADEEKAFVKFSPGLFSHIYANVRPIEPFPFKGAQRWKNLDQETIDRINYLNEKGVKS